MGRREFCAIPLALLTACKDMWAGGRQAAGYTAAPGGGGQLVHGQDFTVNGSNFGTDGSTLLVHDYGQAGFGVVDSQWSGHQPTTAGSIYDMQNRDPTVSVAGYVPGRPHPFVQSVKGGCHLNLNTSTGGNDVDVTKNFPSTPATPYPIWAQGWFCFHPLWFFNTGAAPPENDENKKFLNFNYGTGNDYAADEWYTNYDDGSVTSVNVTHAQISTNAAAEGTWEVPPTGHQGGGVNSATFWGDEDTSFNGTTTSTNWSCREIEMVADTVSWTTGGKGYFNEWGTRLSLGTYRSQSVNYIGKTDKAVNVGSRSFNWGGYARARSATNFRFGGDEFMLIGSTGDVTVNRLMLGDQPTLAACTKLVYQTPVSWADGQIIATCWKGALSSGPVYPYVYNRNGTVVSGTVRTMT